MNEKARDLDHRRTVYFEDANEGDSAQISRTITEQDLVLFAEVSGDRNPVHLDADYAAKTPFKKRIAHGSLCASFISAVFGSEFPGPGCIYVSQSLRFKAPVFIGDTVVVKIEVKQKIPERRFVEFVTQCFVDEKLVLDGEAVLRLPERS